MIKTKEELLEVIRGLGGESPSDEIISLLDDITDTMDSIPNVDELNSRIETLEGEKEQLDSEWRKKYTDRFFSSGEEEEIRPNEEPDEEKESYEYDDLFKEEE